MADPTLPFSNPTTSLHAARRARRSGATQKDRVLAFLSKVRGATADGVSSATGVPIRQASTRIRSLVLDGVVRDSGRTITSSATGFPAIVWEVFAGQPLDRSKLLSRASKAAIRATWLEAAKIAEDETDPIGARSANPGERLARIFRSKASLL